jgi:Bifunctional DNA primase/polymerase, N-terminal
MADIYATWAPVFRARGFWPRPIRPGTKACHFKDWQLPDDQQPRARIENWSTQCAAHGIGLLMGSPLPDGLRLGAIDVDRDDYVRLARVLLRDPVCGRFGRKGAVFFVRVRGRLRNPEFRVQGPDRSAGKVAECLFDRKLCVIPPSVHPDTSAPYRWVGTALHEAPSDPIKGGAPFLGIDANG